MNENRPILSIIIVNYNSKDVLKDCLASITKSQFPFSFEVYIIDNASVESIEDVRQEYTSFNYIINDDNYGFSFANNRGIMQSKGKYILLLNPDTILNGDSLQPMITYLEQHDDVGIVGCKIFNLKGEIEHSTHSFPNLIKEFIHANEPFKILIGYNGYLGKVFKKNIKLKSLESYWGHDSTKEVDHVTGACMMVKREVIDRVGPLDESFFLYNEEVEWSYRIKKSGYKSIFLPDSNIVHLFGYSTQQQVQKQIVNKLLVERYRGMFNFFQKHYSFIKLFILRLIVIEGFSIRLVVCCVKLLNPICNKIALAKEIRLITNIIKLAFVTHYDWRISATAKNK